MPSQMKLSTVVHRRLAFSVAALAGLLFGYDVGVISGALIFIHKALATTAAQDGMIVSTVPFGALLAAALGGRLNDMLGRRDSLLVTASLFIFGSLLCALADTVPVLIVGRFLLGLAVGVGSFSAPLYIAELSASADRGRLVTMNQLAITLGILLAYFIDYCFAPTANWRMMLGLGAVPAAFLAAGIGLLPRSPRWLLLKGRRKQAYLSLRELYGESRVREEFREIVKSFSGSIKLTFADIASGNFFKVLVLGVMVSIITQAVGINAIIYYAPVIFNHAGFSSGQGDIMATVGLGVINVVFTIIAMLRLDKAGRRKMLLGGMLGIIVSLLVLVVAFLYGIHTFWMTWAAFLCLGLFVASQAIGTGPACWLVPSEIFPTSMRSVGMSISVAFNWATNVVVAMLFPIILLYHGPAVVFTIFLVIALLGWWYFYVCLPETKGLSLETIEENLRLGKSLRDLGSVSDKSAS